MKNVSTLTIGFSIIVFTLLSATIDTANPDSVSTLRRTDDISRSKAAFAVVGEEIARGLNLHILSESDYWKLRGPVLLDPQTDIHFQLREHFDRIVNTVDFGASLDAGSSSQNSPISRGNKPVLYKKASEIIRDFIARGYISVIIVSHAPIGMGEMAAIRGLQGEVRYTYEIINSASVFVPLKNVASLIKLPFITEVWPNSKGHLALADSTPQIGADKVHKQPANGGLGVTGKGVFVGVVDTGIYRTHSEFTGRLSRGNERGLTHALSDPDEITYCGNNTELHGTFVAGIIGAADNGNNITGVAPEVEFLDAAYVLLLRRVFEGDYDDAMDAIKWAAHPPRWYAPDADDKADVVNLSSGWPPWMYGRKGEDPMSKLINDLVADHGKVFVTSAGNGALRRTSGPIWATGDNAIHNFDIKNQDAVRVTLIWGDHTEDLDLVIWDSSNGKKIRESSNHGTYYEQLDFDTNQSHKYTVQVVGHDVSSPQQYEVWLTGKNGCEKNPEFESPNSEKTVFVPGYSRNVITVGAVDMDKNNKIADSSSQGSDTDLIKPEVVAPGVDITSPVAPGGYATRSGTSAAAPHVAGVAALILDAVGKNKAGKWNFSPDEVKSAIVRGAEDITNKLPNNTFGAGLVKADNIIFGGTVNPGKKLCFKITLRLVKYWYNNFYLNAENDYPRDVSVAFAVAISWEDNSRDLDLEFLDQNGNPVGPLVAHDQESNYEKISARLPMAFNPGDFFYLNVIHNNPAGKSIRFTGASTHPIKRVELDVNCDGVVNLKDLVEVAKKFKAVGVNIEDINGDGIVDLDDMKIIAKKMAGAPAAPTGSQVAIETIQQWLAEAKQTGNTDPDFLRGIAMLEQLVALLTPMETALLANYPNPFNPETWIPYQLATTADVTLTIYDIQGRVVRALDLGHQRAGTYHARSRAAYWDGRNAVGEPVASGVYFYTLKAGDFSATRKLLIRK
ncbi:MAG: S8 family serine peptidase [Candidatus Poribacteria bacterium]|nr:S8 family serine peptidase [Candidatus Poribacteria bacterium]